MPFRERGLAGVVDRGGPENQAQAGKHGAGEHARFRRTADYRTAMERIVAHRLDAIEDGDTGAGEELNVDADVRSQAASQWRASGEERTGARDDVFHHVHVAG